MARDHFSEDYSVAESKIGWALGAGLRIGSMALAGFIGTKQGDNGLGERLVALWPAALVATAGVRMGFERGAAQLRLGQQRRTAFSWGADRTMRTENADRRLIALNTMPGVLLMSETAGMKISDITNGVNDLLPPEVTSSVLVGVAGLAAVLEEAVVHAAGASTNTQPLLHRLTFIAR